MSTYLIYLYNYTDIVQYEGVIQLPDDFYDTTKRQTIPGKLSDLIREVHFSSYV